MENGEELLRIVFDKSNTEDLEDQFKQLNITSNDIGVYLQHLTSFGLNKLTKESDRISEEKASIINQTQELAFEEYPTFIEAAQCTHDIFQNFQNVSRSTEKLSTNLTQLKERCLEFSQTAQSLNATRVLTSLALSRHTQLLEILELPQLMDTCVRNGYWEEALELASYVSRLQRKLAHIPLILKVAQEVQSCTKLMLSQLVSQLRMPAQLPHCLKVVGYLRRMGVFSDEEIRLKFLQARDAWFKSTLEEIPKDNAYQHMLKTVELSRVHLFDIATQYRAIFTDEDPLVLANQNIHTNESAIFHTWIVGKVTDFLFTLECDLPQVSPSSLESVFNQCMYFGLSFGRIGADFRVLLVPIFSRVVLDRFDQSLLAAQTQFSDSMSKFCVQTQATSASSASAHSVTNTGDQVQPPFELTKFRPLAELCNAIIVSFNDLCCCAPVDLVDLVTRKLEQTLRSCSQVMADFHRQEKGAFTSSEQKEFAKCCFLYENEFLHYVQKILHLIFTPALLSLQTGFTSSEILKQDLAMLNKEFILEPVSHLLTQVAALVPESVGTPPAPIPESTETLPAAALEPSEAGEELGAAPSNVEDAEATPTAPVDIEEVVFQPSVGEDEETVEDTTTTTLPPQVLESLPAPILESSEAPRVPDASSAEVTPAAPVDMEEVVFQLSDDEQEVPESKVPTREKTVVSVDENDKEIEPF